MTPTGGHAFSPRRRLRARAAIHRAVDYLRGRQSANGGFCFYRWLGIDEPNLHDTWHAVAALTLAGATVPRMEAVAASLAGYAVGSAAALYQRAFALDRLGFGARLAPNELVQIHALDPTAAMQDPTPLTARLEVMLRALALRRRFDAAPVDAAAAAHCVDRQCHAGAWGVKPNLRDTALAVAILALLDVPIGSDATRDFIDSLQVASFAFAATPDSLFADLDTVHAGLAACALLGMPVRHPDDAVDYVLACQGGNGGFARAPDGLPDIGRTHRALQSLGLSGIAQTFPDPATPIAAAL